MQLAVARNQLRATAGRHDLAPSAVAAAAWSRLRRRRLGRDPDGSEQRHAVTFGDCGGRGGVL